MTNSPSIPGAIQLDHILQQAQFGLIDNLEWLDASFGRAQRLMKKTPEGKIVKFPAVFCGNWRGRGDNDYIEVSPDSKIGNFSYFEIDDPQTIESAPWARSVKTPFSLVMWFDLADIYDTPSNRNIEYIKARALHILNGGTGWHLTDGRIAINKVYERAENIYRGYTLSEIDNQFLMHPYGGLRFEGEIDYTEMCFNGPIPPELTWYLRTKDGLYVITSDGKKVLINH